jgi:Glycosyl hydrolases family 2, TIM barrel domain/Glycosyl hydrolases family 2
MFVAFCSKQQGIHRSIEIIRRPRTADIVDFQVQADANGHFECCVEYRTRKWHNDSTSVKTKDEVKAIGYEDKSTIQEHHESQSDMNHNYDTSTDRLIITRLYNDRQLSADGSEWEAGECIWERQQRISLTSDTRRTARINFTDTIQNIKTWSAEIPNLYTLTISLYEHIHVSDTTSPIDTNEATLSCLQSESFRIGFRTINILSPGVIYINEKRIKNFSGMNRHEHSPDHGKVVSLESMEQDICLLK